MKKEPKIPSCSRKRIHFANTMKDGEQSQKPPFSDDAVPQRQNDRISPLLRTFPTLTIFLSRVPTQKSLSDNLNQRSQSFRLKHVLFGPFKLGVNTHSFYYFTIDTLTDKSEWNRKEVV